MRSPSLLLAAMVSVGGTAVAGGRLPPPSDGSASRAQAATAAAFLVRRGEWAVLSTSQGGVAVESRVEVLQDGKAGQRVLVRGSAWPQPIAARVFGPGSVEPAR